MKTVAVYHKPDWILKVVKWASAFTGEVRYYLDLYYHSEFLSVYRIEGENEWINNQDKTRMNFTEDEQRILKKVEESFKLETVRKNRR
ncbi:hypothetical protein IMAU80756_01144 [Lactobacillus helveticus]|nr:hypothetical protein [Lactobacillus helveticus]